MVRSPWIVIAVVLALSAALASQIPHLESKVAPQTVLAEDDPDRLDFERFREYFGRSESFALAIRVPGRISDSVFLARLGALHRDLEAHVPFVGRVTSLIDVRHTEARGDELYIGDLVEEIPTTALARAALEDKIRASDLYPNYVISPDHRWTMVTVESLLAVGGEADPMDFGASEEPSRALTEQDDLDMMAAIREIVGRHEAADFEIRMAGAIPVEVTLGQSVRKDFAKVLLIALVVIAGLLLVLFRSPLIVALVVSVVLLSIVGTVGFMALVGIPVSFGTQILPAFLFAAGVGYAVHVATLFRQNMGPGADRRAAVEDAVDHAARPVVMTALTTIGGLVSFAPSDLVAISQIGVFAPAGVLLAVSYSLALLPALLVVLPVGVAKTRVEIGGMQRGLAAIGLWSIDHRALVLGAVGCLIGAAALGTLHLRSSHDTLSWHRSAIELKQTTDLIDTQFGGATAVEFLVEARDGVTLRDPRLLNSMAATEDRLLELEVGPVKTRKVLGLHRVVQELNRALHADDPDAYRIPDDAGLVAQELMLFESAGTDDLERLVDSTFTVGRLAARVNREDAYFTAPYSEAALAIAQEEIGDLADVRLGGMQPLVTRTFVAVNESMVESYAIAFVVVSLMLIAMVGDVRVGLLVLIPNVTPILLAVGAMGWFGIPVTMLTLLVGSIALGLAVDDTIHFTHGFQRDFARHGDVRRATAQTLRTTGVALVFTSVSLVCGFLAFGFGALSTMFDFGVVAAIAISAALAMDLIVLPALMAWHFEPRRLAETPHRAEAIVTGVRRPAV